MVIQNFLGSKHVNNFTFKERELKGTSLNIASFLLEGPFCLCTPWKGANTVLRG